MLTLGLLLFPRLTQLDLTAPFEVFTKIPDSRTLLIAPTPAPVTADSGLTLLPTTTYADAPQLDVICVPGGIGVNPLMQDPVTIAFLQQQSQHARYITSVCTGALVLGAAGLLNGYRATTHWLSLDLLPLFGATPVKDRVVIDRNRITAGGVTSGIDFALTLAAELASAPIAREIALFMEYNPEPPFPGHPDTAAPETVRALAQSRQATQAERRRIIESLNFS